jgi:hypothetical protein
MSEPTERLPVEVERAEFERLLKDFARFHRLILLLQFLGKHYFAGESEQIDEYNIATQVFGRSKTAFNPSEDSIVRVEAHRLRKRLKEFYEKEGRDRTIQMSLPLGNYIPTFRVANPGAKDKSAPDTDRQPEQTVAAPTSGTVATVPPVPKAQGLRAFWRKPGKLYPVLGGGLFLLLLAVGWFVVTNNSAPRQTQKATESARGAKLPDSNAPFQPIRILSGYTGKPQMDKSGQFWSADQYFSGGGAWTRNAQTLYRSSEPFLYEHWRSGDFSYSIPLAPGTYELHLYFVTDNTGEDGGSGFSVRINDDLVLQNFDINSDALGANVADERIFRDVTPDKNGYLNINFSSEQGKPSLTALEILPGTLHAQLPIRMVMQPRPVIDHNGTRWSPDNYSMNGYLSNRRIPLAGTPDPDLFASERYGHFNYAIPVDTRDRYTLVLHFAELYFGNQTHGDETGKRIFRVMCNGVMLLDDFDIYKEVGGGHELTRTFRHIKPSPQGKLNLTFEPIVNNATISGIEVLDESK